MPPTGRQASRPVARLTTIRFLREGGASLHIGSIKQSWIGAQQVSNRKLRKFLRVSNEVCRPWTAVMAECNEHKSGRRQMCQHDAEHANAVGAIRRAPLREPLNMSIV